MRNFVLFSALLAAPLLAQTADTVAFRAVLRPENEVPAVNVNASGAATVLLHVVRDANGRIVSGSADFIVNYRLPGAATLTGLHIHRGIAGANGPVTIDSGLRSTPDPTGTTGVSLQGQIRMDNPAALASATDLLVNPAGHYVNLHTSEFPGGIIRGQLERADMRVFLTLMNPQNEVPAVTNSNASGVGSFTLVTTQRPDGTLTSASGTFEVAYTGFAPDLTFTGFHIHRGGAGANGPVTIDSSLRTAMNRTSGPTGAGVMTFPVEIDLSNPQALATVYDLLSVPTTHYFNLHTTANPGGEIRGQLRATDQMSLRSLLLPSNEVPPVTDLDASAPAVFWAWTIRDAQGRAQAASVAFDVNFRFPAAVTFTGLHVHTGAAGANGPVTIDSGIRGSATVVSANGFGNIFRQVTLQPGPGLNTLNNVLTAPEGAYLNLHTTANPGGAVRAQLAGPAAAPRVDSVISAASDPTYGNTAPLGLITVYGADLTRVGSTGTGGPTADAAGSLNGTQVILANRAAAILSATPTQISAQTPADAPSGMQPLYVISPSGTSNTVMVNVQPTAPGVFLSANVPQGNVALALRATDFSWITAAAPAASGDRIWLFLTGLGQTTPALGTGQATPIGINPFETALPAVTIGGRPATVSAALSWTGLVGMYLVEVTVPAGTGAGWQPLRVTAAGNASNATILPLR